MNETSYEPGDPAWEITKALAHGASVDGELFRARLRIAGVLDTPGDLMAEPGLLNRVKRVGRRLAGSSAARPRPQATSAVAWLLN